MLDPILLKTFLTVAQTRSFTEAGRRLGLRQSTVSQHIRRLEAAATRRLFIRDTHSVVPTADGEAMVGFAHSVLEVDARAERYFVGSELRGRVRLGASEDFVLSRVPEVLRQFTRNHPSVDLELTVGLSGLLYEKLDGGELDLIFCKRKAGDERGRLVWREQLVWIGSDPGLVDPERPLPLILFPPPSITRAAALAAVERAGRSWRITCTSGSLSGLRAAALAGLGITAHSRHLIPSGLSAMPVLPHLPELDEVEFVLVGASRDDKGPGAELAAAILANADRLQHDRFS